MSSYSKKIKHPITGKEQEALFIDHGIKYKVYFRKDGTDASMLDTLDKLEMFKEDEIKG